MAHRCLNDRAVGGEVWAWASAPPASNHLYPPPVSLPSPYLPSPLLFHLFSSLPSSNYLTQTPIRMTPMKTDDRGQRGARQGSSRGSLPCVSSAFSPQNNVVITCAESPWQELGKRSCRGLGWGGSQGEGGVSATGVLSLKGEKVEDNSFIPRCPSINPSALSLCFSLYLPSFLDPSLLLPTPSLTILPSDPSWASPLLHACQPLSPLPPLDSPYPSGRASSFTRPLVCPSALRHWW